MAAAERGDAITVDLQTCEIRLPDGDRHSFGVDPVRRHNLLAGLDEIELTLRDAAAIDAFETAWMSSRPWLLDGSPPPGVPRGR